MVWEAVKRQTARCATECTPIELLRMRDSVDRSTLSVLDPCGNALDF